MNKQTVIKYFMWFMMVCVGISVTYSSGSNLWVAGAYPLGILMGALYVIQRIGEK